MQLTKEQKEKYLKKNDACPFCGEETILSFGDVENDVDSDGIVIAFRDMVCQGSHPWVAIPNEKTPNYEGSFLLNRRL